MQFAFKTDEESFEFSVEVVKALSIGFEMSETEALRLINKKWGYLQFFGSEHPFHHESPNYFANEMYFGYGSYWWLSEELRSIKGLAQLPRPPLKEGV